MRELANDAIPDMLYDISTNYAHHIFGIMFQVKAYYIYFELIPVYNDTNNIKQMLWDNLRS